jgi:D-arabinonate dehydratase/D-galactarolactone cycloisomerase
VRVKRLSVYVLSAGNEGYWGAQSWGATQQRPFLDYPPASRRTFVYAGAIQAVLVRIETEDGVVGWGEAKAPVGPAATARIIEELLAPIVVGARVDETRLLWDRMYSGMRVRGHDSGFWLEALSGVDIALWDAWARTLGQPLHTLLGGRYRTSVPVYASGIPATLGPDAAHELAIRYRGAGFRATKVAVGADWRRDVEAVEAVRDVFDEVYADAAGTYDLPVALHVGRELSRLGVGFFEMPIAPEHLDGYGVLASKLDIPLALDSLPNRYRALEFLKRGALHVLQPDVCRAGGITELMRIADLADAFGAQATPHVSIGSAVHFAASLQCAAAIGNLAVMEHWVGDNPLGGAIAPDLDVPADGRRSVTSAPGLGITVDETAVLRLAA